MMLSSLRFYSFFNKAIKIYRKNKLPEELQPLVSRIDQEEQVAGRVFRPYPEISWIMTVVMTPGTLLMCYFVFPVVFSTNPNFNKPWWAYLLVAVPLFLFYYSWFIYWLAPWWLKHNTDKFFIYIGPEGILRQEWKKVAFIPWSLISGAVHCTSVRGHGHSLELTINKKSIFNPKLIRGTDMANIFVDWVEYDSSDMRDMTSLINHYSQTNK